MLLLLLVPALWSLVLMVADGGREADFPGIAPASWDLSKLRVAARHQGQAEALTAVFRLEPIPVNSAGPDLLTIIPGIGPELAGRIVDERSRSGPFASAADLGRVRGIGAVRVRSFQPYLSFD